MNNVIVFTNQNGSVSICFPTGELSIQEVKAKDIPNNIESYIVQYDSLPISNNDFFDAWEQNKGVITINISKAKEITKKRLRVEREPYLLAQDVAFQRALETGADTSEIVAEKNRLRNITSLTDSCNSLEELRSITII